MAVTAKRLVTFIPHKRQEITVNEKETVSIKEMETSLELDKIKSIILSPSDAKDQVKNDDYFKDWYEDELRRIYEGK